jgi:hypothetical protein
MDLPPFSASPAPLPIWLKLGTGQFSNNLLNGFEFLENPCIEINTLCDRFDCI